MNQKVCSWIVTAGLIAQVAWGEEAAKPAAAPAAIDQLAAAVGRINVNAPPLLQFDFAARYPRNHTPTPALSDGHQVVIGTYLVPTQHVSSYFAHVSPDGMQAIFGMQIPRVFADVFARTVSEMDPLDPDFAAIVAAARETTNLGIPIRESFGYTVSINCAIP